MTVSAMVCARLAMMRSSVVAGSSGHVWLATLVIAMGTAAASV